MTKHDFLNRLRSLHCLEYDNTMFCLTGRQHFEFSRSPADFMMRCDDETADKIWAAIEARQKATLP